MESEGLGSILNKLKNSVNGDEVAFANMFSSVEAKNAVLALAGNQAENFAEKTQAMYEASGAADAAFRTQTDSIKEMMSRVKNAGSVMLQSLGEQALPYIQDALEGVIDRIPELTEAFGGIIEKAGPVFGNLVGSVSGFITKARPFAVQIATMFENSFMQALPAITTLKDNFTSILPAVEPVVMTLAGVISSAVPPIAEIFAGVSSVVAQVMPVISEIVSEVGEKVSGVFSSMGSSTSGLRQLFETAGPAISSVLSTAWEVISPILDLAIQGVGLIADAIGWAFPYIQGIIETVWSVIGPIFSKIGEGIGAVTDAVKRIRGIDDGGGDAGGGSTGGSVPAHATGTQYFSGGWTTVGEHGPELMNLPTGSKILSNSESKTVQGNRNIEINIAHMEVRSDADINAVAEELARKLEEAEENQ